jgi:hypothetical protein
MRLPILDWHVCFLNHNSAVIYDLIINWFGEMCDQPMNYVFLWVVLLELVVMNGLMVVMHE